MKNVWIFNHYAQEPRGAGGTRHFDLASHLQPFGWKASIIAASVEHQTNRQRLAGNEKRRVDTYEGVSFVWLRTSPYQGNGAGRMKNMLEYTMRALQPSAVHGLNLPNVIIGSSVHPFAAWAGARLAERYKVPFIFEVRDLWPQTLIDMGRLKDGSPIARMLRMLEAHLYRKADRIITLLPRAYDYIGPIGVPESKVVWLPNGVDLSNASPTHLPSKSDGFTLMYFGAHGDANGLDNVLRSMHLLKRNHPRNVVRLRLIGDGPAKPGLIKMASELGLDNVCFEEPVPKRQIPALASQADAFVFNLIDAPVFKFGISSNKLFDFMAAARPILFCCDAGNNPVADSGCGVTVAPGQPQALADAIEYLMTTGPGERQLMGQAGRRYVEANHGFDRLSKRLAEVLDDCIDGWK